MKKVCSHPKPDCFDKDSIHYFIYHMTEKEFWERCPKSWHKDYEIGVSLAERFLINKIRMKDIEKIEERMNEESK